jgi:hypothetical protein
MTDDAKHAATSGNTISLSNPHEVRSWMLIFGCDEATLCHAVATVGTSADRVREYMARHTRLASRPSAGDERDDKRIFGWAVVVIAILLVLVVTYNFFAFERESPLPQSAQTTTSSSTQPQK